MGRQDGQSTERDDRMDKPLTGWRTGQNDWMGRRIIAVMCVYNARHVYINIKRKTKWIVGFS